MKYYALLLIIRIIHDLIFTCFKSEMCKSDLFISNALVAVIDIDECNKSTLIDGDLIIESDEEKSSDDLPIDKDIQNLP